MAVTISGDTPNFSAATITALTSTTGTVTTGTVTTLTTTTISDGTNSTSSTNCIQGSAKAWVNFAGSTTIRASYNVSSITVNGSGDFTVNFTNAFSDANYAMAGIAGAGSAQLACLVQPFNAYAPTTSACRFQTIYVNGSVIGASTVSVAFFR
jgi:hypothetical protein